MTAKTSVRARRGRPALCESEDPVVRIMGNVQTIMSMARTLKTIRSMPLGSERVERMLATLGRALTAVEVDMGMTPGPDIWDGGLLGETGPGGEGA